MMKRIVKGILLNGRDSQGSVRIIEPRAYLVLVVVLGLYSIMIVLANMLIILIVDRHSNRQRYNARTLRNTDR